MKVSAVALVLCLCFTSSVCFSLGGTFKELRHIPAVQKMTERIESYNHQVRLADLLTTKRQAATCDAGGACDNDADCFGEVYKCCGEDPSKTCFAKDYAVELGGTCQYDMDSDECSDDCAEAIFDRGTNCVVTSDTATSGTCRYILDIGCDCTHDSQCGSDLRCVDSTCDYMRSTGEDCGKDSHCWSGDCDGTCQGIAAGEECPETENGSPCVTGHYCVPSNPFNFAQLGANNYTCQPTVGSGNACSFLDVVSGACGPGRLCDVPVLQDSNSFSEECFNFTTGVYKECGICRSVFGGEIGDPCNSALACRFDLQCNPSTNQCEAYVEDRPCNETRGVCLGSCACNGGDPECSEVGNDLSVVSSDAECVSDLVEFFVTCPRNAGCVSIFGSFEEPSCSFQNCEEEALAAVCTCVANVDGVTEPCGVTCGATSTFERPAACCTGVDCSRDGLDACACPNNACECDDECTCNGICGSDSDSSPASATLHWL